MKIIGVDTTGAAGSLALLDGEDLRGVDGFTTRQGHAGKLLPAFDHFLKQNEVGLEEIDAWAVCVGPGSFTGLRIGIATVEGLAFATGRPVVGVSALEATAHPYRFRRGLVVALLDARRREVFAAVYRALGTSLQPVGEPTCEAPEDFLARLPDENVLVAGSGLTAYADTVRRSLGARAILGERTHFLAPEVARIGARLHREGKAAQLGGLRALYLRPPDAERSRASKDDDGGGEGLGDGVVFKGASERGEP